MDSQLQRLRKGFSITRGRVPSTTAGSGAVGYSSAPDSSTSATLADPAAVAYDSAGNIYLADAGNQVLPEVTTSGVINTVAGTGIEGYGGDGSAAPAAGGSCPAMPIALSAGLSCTQNMEYVPIATGRVAARWCLSGTA